MRKLGIGYGGIKYASVVGNNTAETATGALLDTLAEGSIGIYGLRISTGLTELLNASSTFSNYSEFTIYQGGKDTGELIKVLSFKADELKHVANNAYTAPTKTVIYVGYDGSTGLLNLPTLVNGDSAVLGIRVNPNTTNPAFYDSVTYDAGKLYSTDTQYSVLAKLANAINAEKASVRHAVAEILTNVSSTTITAATTGSAVVVKVGSNTPTVTGSVTKGSKTLTYALSASTFSASGQVIAVGDYVQIAGYLYKIAALDYTTSNAAFVITLDRAYEGTTLSAAAASNFKHFSTQPTNSDKFGLKVTGYTAGVGLTVSVDSVLENSTLSTADTAVPMVQASSGIGTGAKLVDYENQTFFWRGGQDTAELPNASPTTKYTSSSKTYNVYSLVIKTNYAAPFGTSNSVGNNDFTAVVAFETQSNGTGYVSAGDNQKVFDDTIIALATAYNVPMQINSVI